MENYHCLLTRGYQEEVIKVITKQCEDPENIKPPVIIDDDTGQYILKRQAIGRLFIYQPVDTINADEL